MSLEQKQQIQYLLVQYLYGKATKKQEDQLFQLLETEQDHSAWQDLIEELMAAEPQLENYDPQAWEPVIQNILNRAATEKRKGLLRPITKNTYWIAAASVLILMVLAGIVYFTQKQDSVPTVVSNIPENKISNDISPGHEGAILTLSNNQQIILDDALNGLITKEGSSAITKNDGTLVYAPSEQQVSGKVIYNTMTTPKGRQYSLMLSDGSRVWLNAASSITFPVTFAANERRVFITGEVFMEVSHDADKPFVVQKDDVAVKVLGTSFNINAYDDNEALTVTLLNGSVNVLHTITGASRVLTPEQQAIINHNGQINLKNKVDTESAVAWKNGFFDFKSADIKSLMSQAARWYDIEVEYQGEKPKDKFTGRISRNVNLSEFLKVLEYSEVKVKLEGRKIIILI